MKITKTNKNNNKKLQQAEPLVETKNPYRGWGFTDANIPPFPHKTKQSRKKHKKEKEKISG